MNSPTFTPAASADPALLAAYQVRLAKLKPACSRCGRALGKREIDARRCSNRDDCLLRQIFAGRPRGEGKALHLSEVHELQRTAARIASTS